MANRSFLLRQRWLKNILRCLYILSISLTAFSTPSHAPVQLTSYPGYSMPQTSPVLSFFFSQLSHVHFPLLLVQPIFRDYMNRSSHSEPQSHSKHGRGGGYFPPNTLAFNKIKKARK
ncbi:unnamed protein product, partial [Ectocarpus sp. 8 AP-2014]